MSERLKIGEILVQLGHLHRSQLSQALDYQARLALHKPLGAVLVEDLEMCTQAQVDEALKIQDGQTIN